MPHLCVDALEVGTQVISALQRLMSRKMNPLLPAVVTAASFHTGSTFNTITCEAVICGKTRTFDWTTWESLPKRMEKVIKGVCDSINAEYE